MKFRTIIFIIGMLSIYRITGSFNLNKPRNSWTTKIYDAAILARPHWAEPVPVRVCYTFLPGCAARLFGLRFSAGRVGLKTEITANIVMANNYFTLGLEGVKSTFGRILVSSLFHARHPDPTKGGIFEGGEHLRIEERVAFRMAIPSDGNPYCFGHSASASIFWPGHFPRGSLAGSRRRNSTSARLGSPRRGDRQ